MEYSVSDYHHIPPRPPTRRSSTRVSAQGVNRRQSQYSILEDGMPRKSQSYRQASVAETEESYDPFRTSRNPIDQRQADHARVTVLRGSSTVSRSQQPNGVNLKRASLRKTPARRNAVLGSTNDDIYSIPSSPPAVPSAGSSQYQKLHSDQPVSRVMSRRSFMSISSGRPVPVRQSMSYKRGVSFVHTHAKKRSISAQPQPLTLQERYSKDRLACTSSLPSLSAKDSPVPSTPQIVRSKKPPVNWTAEQLLAAGDPTIPSVYWKDDARKVSTELEKYIDEAFNRSSVASTAPTAHTVVTDPPERSYGSPATSVSVVREDSDMPFKHPHRGAPPARPIRPSDLQRPLPKPPVPASEYLGSSAQHDLARTMDLLKQRAADPSMAMAPGCLDDVIAHLERLMQPSTVRAYEPRRFVSTPDQNSPALGRSEDTFDRLMEKGNIGFRAASEPVGGGYADSPRRQKYPNKETLRLVQPDEKPISPTKPLTIRKKSGSSTPTTPSGGSVRTSAQPPPPSPREHAHIPINERRIAGLSQLVDAPLESIDEDKENFDPLPRNSKTLSGEGKKRNWFRRQQEVQRGIESPDKGPPPPLKDSTYEQDWRSASLEKRRSDVPSVESHASEPKKQQSGKGKGKFLKMFGRNKPSKPKLTSGGQSSFSLQPSLMHELTRIDYNLHASPSQSTSASTSTSNAHNPSSCLMSGALPHPAKPLSKPQNHNNPLNPRHTLSTISTLPTNRPPRAIQPHQNWLQRFLRVKPATAILSFSIGKVRARKEIAGLLREWRKYGIRDIVVDKETCRIWAKVARVNCPSFSFRFPFSSCAR